MRHSKRVAGMVALLLGLVSMAPLLGQPTQKSTEREPSQNEARRFRRLPNHFGRLGLSDEQREKIYAVQVEYGQKIAALRRQIEELDHQRDEANRGVLTEEQRAKLDQLLAEARQRREARRRANRKNAEPSDNGKSPDSP